MVMKLHTVSDRGKESLHFPPIHTNRSGPKAWLVIYVAIGLLGVAAYGDEFDAFKIPVIGYVGIPALSMLLLFSWLYPTWERKWVGAYRMTQTIIVMSFGLGILTILNALAGPPTKLPQSLASKGVMVNAEKHPGRFGILYHRRF